MGHTGMGCLLLSKSKAAYNFTGKGRSKIMADNAALNEEVREYYHRTLPGILAALPLNTGKRIGIYGLGMHTERLLEQYTDKVGAITADIIMVDSRRASGTEKYHGYDVWNVKDIGGLGLEGMILSSSLYEKEMYQTVQALYPGLFPVYRFYEDEQQEDIFIYKGFYSGVASAVRPVLKIGFTDMWPSFGIGDYDITRILSEKFCLELSSRPDILFCGQFGEEHKKYGNCKKVLWITEPWELHLDDYDYAFGFPYVEREGYLRYNTYAPRSNLIQCRDAFADEALAHRKFCNFIYSQDAFGEGARLRKEFCLALEKYRHVDCPGKVLNNMASDCLAPRFAKNQWESKMDFIKQYKFTIAFENHSIPGYSTEKLWQAFCAGSVPIYWGNPCVLQEVNAESFINCNDYGNDFEAVINRIREVDENDELYMSMLRHAPMKAGYDFSTKALEDFLYKITE